MGLMFDAGYVSYLEKMGFYIPRLQYNQPSEDEPMSWKESVEKAAKTVFGIEEPMPTSGYGVTTTRPGTKQQLTYGTQNVATNDLKKKWDVPGLKPTTVGSSRKGDLRNMTKGYLSTRKVAEADGHWEDWRFDGRPLSKVFGNSAKYKFPAGKTDRNLVTGRDVVQVWRPGPAKPAVTAAPKPAANVAAKPKKTAPAANARDGVYTVARGDVLGGIAGRFGVPLASLIEANGIKDPDKISVGQSLVIPGGTGRAGQDEAASYGLPAEYANLDPGTASAVDLAVKHIMEREGFRSKPYFDRTGYAIGYGSHTYDDGRKVRLGDPAIGRSMAVKLLKSHLSRNVIPKVNGAVGKNVKMSPRQTAALYSLVYNIPATMSPTDSTLLRRLNAGEDVNTVFAEEFPRWVSPKVQSTLKGMINRRLSELQLAGIPYSSVKYINPIVQEAVDNYGLGY